VSPGPEKICGPEKGNDLSRNGDHGTALRTDLVLLAGHYGRRWFAVAEAGCGRPG